VEDDHQLAERLAAAAGRLLMGVRSEFSEADEQTRKDHGDQRSHEFLMDALAQARPDDAVLSEEGADDHARLDHERVWIIDPLDGTREFGELPRTDWAVHVGLAVGGEPVVGAVALPALDTTFVTGAGLSLPLPEGGPTRVISSRTRPGPAAEVIAAELEAAVLLRGSAGAKAMAVVCGEADVYAHTGGQYEWDSCAPVAVALATGLHASRIDGSPLVYNNANPYVPDLLICRPELAEAALGAVERAGL